MDVEYLKEHVAAALEEGLATVASYQPEDSVEFLGHYLLKYVQNQNLEAQRQRQQQQLEADTKAAAAKAEAEAREAAAVKQQVDAAQKQADDLLSALDVSSGNEPDDVLPLVARALAAFTDSSHAYVGIKEAPAEGEEKGSVRYIAATEGAEHMLGQTLAEGEGVTFDVWKLPPKPEDEEGGDEDEDGEGKKETPPDFQPVNVRNVLLNRQLKFFRTPAPGAFLALPVRYKSTLFDGSIADDAVAAHAAAVAAANEKIAEIQAKRAEIEAARAAAEEAAKAAAEAAAEAAAAAAEAGEEGGEEGGDGGDGEGKGDDGEGEGKAGEDFDKQLAELEAEPEVPPYPTIASRDVDLVFCLDTLGKGRSYTAADVDTARAWCNAVGAALAALELAAVKEDWDEAKAQEQGNAKAVEEDEAEAEGAAKAVEEELAGIGEDLEDHEKAHAEALIRLAAAHKKVLKLKSMIAEVKRRRVAPKPLPLKVLQAVLYGVGYKHSSFCDGNARNKDAIVWKRMKMLFDDDFFQALQSFDPSAEVTGKGSVENLKAMSEGVDMEALRKSSVAIAVLHEWNLAALAAREAAAVKAAKEEEARLAAEAAAKEAADAEAAAAAAAAAEEAEGAGGEEA